MPAASPAFMSRSPRPGRNSPLSKSASASGFSPERREPRHDLRQQLFGFEGERLQRAIILHRHHVEMPRQHDGAAALAPFQRKHIAAARRIAGDRPSTPGRNARGCQLPARQAASSALPSPRARKSASARSPAPAPKDHSSRQRRSYSRTALSSTCEPAAAFLQRGRFRLVVRNAAEAGNEDHRGGRHARDIGGVMARARSHLAHCVTRLVRHLPARTRSGGLRTSPQANSRCAFPPPQRLSPRRSSAARPDRRPPSCPAPSRPDGGGPP
jgi:hypothetical protein